MDNKTLVERLERGAIYATGHTVRDLLREAAAALRATTGEGAASGNYRDAYEGAREDLLDWKGRALRAEARLRSLGWQGVDASEAPATTGEGECCHSYPCQRPGSVRGACTMEAPTPTEPLRDAPTNPGEISSKVVEPLRDAEPLQHGGRPMTLRECAEAEEPLRDAGAVAWAVTWPDTDSLSLVSDDDMAEPMYEHARPLIYGDTHPAPAQVDEGALLARANEVVHHDAACPAIGGNGDTDCRCDAVPFLRDLAAALTAAAKEGKWTDDGFYTYGPDGQRYALRGPD